MNLQLDADGEIVVTPIIAEVLLRMVDDGMSPDEALKMLAEIKRENEERK